MLYTCPLNRPKCWRKTKPGRERVAAVAAGTLKEARAAASYYNEHGIMGQTVLSDRS